MNTADVIDYIYSNNNKNTLFEMDEDELKSLITNICNNLSSEYEYCTYGTYGEHYELDVDTEVVIKHIMEDYKKYKKNKEVKENEINS